MRIPLTCFSSTLLALAGGGELALPALSGEVQQFTLTGRGDIDGFILKDGTEVKTPRALAAQLAFVLKPGARVTIHGLRAAALPLVRAVSVTEDSTHRTITDDETATSPNPPPPPRPRRHGPPGAAPAALQSGRVRMVLHGPQGEVNGVLLESGAIWRFPPDQADQWSSLLQPHEALVAEGTVLASPLGTVVDVAAIGTSRDRLVAVGPRRLNAAK